MSHLLVFTRSWRRPAPGISKKEPAFSVFAPYTSIHRVIIVQEHRHPHIVAKSYSSPSRCFPKPAFFSLHCHGSRLGCETNRLSCSTLQRALLVVIMLTSIRGIKNFTKRNTLGGVNCNYLHEWIFGLPLNLKQF